MLSRRLSALITALMALLVASLSVVPASALSFESKAREAILIDVATGTVLYEKNADVRMPPASMSKLMTAFMAFEALRDGRLSLDDELPVSRKAWKLGGSKMFVLVNTNIPVDALLRGIIVQSGNDACVVLAEGLAGTEEAFADAMTRRAQEIGLTDSSFANATGLPDPDHYMTARDLATLALTIITEFPAYYKYYSETEFTWADIRQTNRNPLLYLDVGADGLKTGYTSEAGYGLVGSAVQDGRRLLFVINGLDSARARSQEAQRLLRYGFREFTTLPLFAAGETVEFLEVWSGAKPDVPLTVTEDTAIAIPKIARRSMKVKVVYNGPVPAPIAAGTHAADLVVEIDGAPYMQRPLITTEAVDKAGILGKLQAGVSYLWRSALPPE